MNIPDHLLFLCCPVCSHAIHMVGRLASCDNSHSFDFSSDGYLNLLLSHQKKSKHPGDTKEMITARRTFLEKNFYKKLSDEINELVKVHCTALQTEKKVIFDVGCGEGYYTNALREYLNDTTIAFLGMDIAKEAIRMAARKYMDIFFFVGNSMKRIPLKDDSVDMILTIFAPRNPLEFARILHSSGIVLIVIPAPNHLSNLRLKLGHNNIKEDKYNQVLTAFKEDFNLIDQKEIQYDTLFNQQDLLSLIKMTPLFWQTSQEAWKNIQSVHELNVNMRFQVLLFKKSQ